MTVSYKYIREDLNAPPLRYNFAPFEGSEFITAYLCVRDKATEDLSSFIENGIANPGSHSTRQRGLFFLFDQLLNNGEFSSSISSEESSEDALEGFIMDENGFDTLKTLTLILFSRISEVLPTPDETDMIIEELGKKFDIFGRLFASYNSSYKKSTDEAAAPSVYAILGIIVADNFINDDSYRYLNLLLKINDLLCGLAKDPESITAALLMLISLKRELVIIKTLERKASL